MTNQSTNKERAALNRAKRAWLPFWLRGKDTPQDERFGAAAQEALDATDAPPVVAQGHGSLYRAGLTLSELKPGECGTVQRLFGPPQGRLRLLEMGLTPGTHIRMLRAAAFGGPLDILVRGYQLSLRRSEAAGVWLDDPDPEMDLEADTQVSQRNDPERRVLEDLVE